MANFVCIFFCFLHFFILFHDTGAMPESSAETIRGSKSSVHIGAIFDPDSTLDGVIAEISMNLAMSDFYALHPNYQTRLHLRVTTAKDLVDTAGAAVDLLENFQVDAIIGPQISAAAPFLVELGEKSQVPIISFFETSPTLSLIESPYFIRVAQNDSVQVKAISAVLQKFNWHEVVLVYEDTDYGTGFISYLVDGLQETNIRVAHMSAIPKSAEDFQISKALLKLMTMQTRVFIVYMNTALASRLFALADQNGMMSKGYAWIITAGLSNSLNVLDSDVVDSMDGVLGVRSHVPKSKELASFDRRWKRELHLMKPNSPLTGINFSGLWAYDTICALARAAEKILPPTNPSFVKPNTSESRIDFASLGAPRIGSRLRDELRNTRFKGLNGEFNLINGQLESSVFEIINVIGNGRVVGYWTPEKGISQNIGSNYKNGLKQIIWPGDSTTTPTGWAIPSLKIGVPVKLGFPEFVEQRKNGNKTTYTGFSIDVFSTVSETLDKDLGFKVLHNFIGFEDETGLMDGSYDDLLLQIKNKAFLKESPLFSYFSKVILLVREIETKMDEIEKRYFGEKVTSATLAPTIYTESSSLRAYNFGGLFIIAGMATLLAITVSERFIWQRPVALVRQYLTSNHPANGIELAAQPTAETDAGDHSSEVHQASGNSGRISVHIKEDIAVE